MGLDTPHVQYQVAKNTLIRTEGHLRSEVPKKGQKLPKYAFGCFRP